MKNSGKSDYSTHLVDKALTYINKHTDLNQPEQVKAFIANLNVTSRYKKNPYASPTTNTPNTVKSNGKCSYTYQKKNQSRYQPEKR